MPELNVTMVAFHGTKKPEPLNKLLCDVLGALSSNLPSNLSWSFGTYSVNQMHATIIGMEADVVDRRLYSRWFQKNKRESREIDIDRLHEVLKGLVHSGEQLFTIRFGGFPESYCKCKDEHRSACHDWPCASAPAELGVFHSCDRSPYQGSFYAFAPGPIMITGWPIAGPGKLECFPHSLYKFRQSLEQAGLVDKYHYHQKHDNAHWKDDDCFIRVGTFRGPIPIEQLRATQQAMRTFLSSMKPVAVDVTVADVSIVLYADPSLEEQYVRKRVPLSEFLENPSCLKRLYDALLQQANG
jgi:hypothetical protein